MNYERLEPISWKMMNDELTLLRGNFWDGYDSDLANITKEGYTFERFGQGQKPERLIKDIIKSTTKKGDLVLDFFMGSGTTAAVAHKMDRQYIGIEQMDYIDSITISRLQKVIEGEQGGISKVVNWQGGGSFVYCKLKELNQVFISQLEQSSTSHEVISILENATEQGFMTPAVIPEDYYSKMDEFTKLSLEKQKQFVMEILDKNKLYVNYCDIDDEDMHVTSKEKLFTHSFYEKNREEEI